MDFEPWAVYNSQVSNQKFVEIINTLKSEIEVLKIQLGKLSSSSTGAQDSEESRKLSKEIISNFRVHWDLKMGIKELEDENWVNSERVKEGSGKDTEMVLRNIQMNDLKKSKMLQELYENMKEKQRLQGRVMEIKDGSRKELVQLQIQVRSLKLEKIELMEKNSNFRMLAEKAKKENSEKDEIINQMRNEIENMQKRLSRQKSAPAMQRPSLSPERKPEKVVKNNENFKVPIHRPTTSLQHARFVNKSKGKLTYFTKSIENFLKAYTGQNDENRCKSPNFKKVPQRANSAFKNQQKNPPKLEPHTAISPVRTKASQASKITPNPTKPLYQNLRVLKPKDLNLQQKIININRCIH